MSSGDRTQAVQNSIPAYDKGVTLPMWAAKLMGVVIEKIGPKGLEYAPLLHRLPLHAQLSIHTAQPS